MITMRYLPIDRRSAARLAILVVATVSWLVWPDILLLCLLLCRGRAPTTGGVTWHAQSDLPPEVLRELEML